MLEISNKPSFFAFVLSSKDIYMQVRYGYGHCEESATQVVMTLKLNYLQFSLGKMSEKLYSNFQIFSISKD